MSDDCREYDDQRYIFYVTFSVYRRRRLLDLDQPKRFVLGVLNQQLKKFEARCVGFVLMPNHVHVLLWLPEPKKLRRFMHGWKRMSSFRIRGWYAQHAPKYFEGFGPGKRFWQPKSYCFHVHSEKKLRGKLDYIHKNPVEAE